MKSEKFNVPDYLNNERLDKCISQLKPDLSRRYIRFLIGNGSTYVNRKRLKIASRQVRSNDTIQIYLQDAEPNLSRQLDKIITVFEDNFLWAVGKPSGMASDQTREGSQLTLVPSLKMTRKDLKYLEAVHRLDKGTSGILLVSKKKSATKKLMELFRNHQIQKRYITLVSGKPEKQKGHIESLLRKNPLDKRKIESHQSEGKRAITLYTMLKYFPEHNTSLMDIKLLTGRTHQIRVHLSDIGHPVVGDWLYGKDIKTIRLMLHAYELAFQHPFSPERCQLRWLPKNIFPGYNLAEIGFFKHV